MPLVTAQDYIYLAFRKLGHLRPGYNASPELLADALTEWGAFFDSLNAEKLTHYTNPDLVIPVTGAGSKSGGHGYDIGPSATDWNAYPRPESIIRANVVLNSVGSQKLRIPLRPITQEEWASISVREITATTTTAVFWYDPQFPNGVFNVFPPLAAGCSIEIFAWGVLTAPATLGTAYAAPPGYADVVLFGLAERLYYMVPKELMPQKVPYIQVAGAAKRALDKVKKLNRPLNTLATDFPSSGRPDGFYDSFVTQTGEPY